MKQACWFTSFFSNEKPRVFAQATSFKCKYAHSEVKRSVIQSNSVSEARKTLDCARQRCWLFVLKTSHSQRESKDSLLWIAQRVSLVESARRLYCVNQQSAQYINYALLQPASSVWAAVSLHLRFFATMNYCLFLATLCFSFLHRKFLQRFFVLEYSTTEKNPVKLSERNRNIIHRLWNADLKSRIIAVAIFNWAWFLNTCNLCV